MKDANLVECWAVWMVALKAVLMAVMMVVKMVEWLVAKMAE